VSDRWWRDPATLKAEVEKHGGFEHASIAHGGTPAMRTLQSWWRKHQLPARAPGPQGTSPAAVENSDDWLLAALKRHKDKASVVELADECDVSPKRVREALDRLNEKGFRVEEEQQEVVLRRLPVPSNAQHKVLFSGDTYRFGIASDFHLNSKHCRLEELHIAYDRFEFEGIETVYCPGDITSGLGIYRTQSYDIINHTFEEQVEFCVENLPRKKSIVTRVVGGNHDQEGEFARAGCNAALAVCNRVKGYEYDGDYDATYTLPQGTTIMVRHPMGGKGYAKSYKPQKFAESFEGGTKPNVLILGHYHDAGYWVERNIHLVMAGCFEGNSNLGKRVPLGSPAVGFWIVEITVAKDGSVVRFRPEFFPFFAGRSVAHAA
jgi:predicted phosphodiesterase